MFLGAIIIDLREGHNKLQLKNVGGEGYPNVSLTNADEESLS